MWQHHQIKIIAFIQQQKVYYIVNAVIVELIRQPRIICPNNFSTLQFVINYKTQDNMQTTGKTIKIPEFMSKVL